MEVVKVEGILFIEVDISSNQPIALLIDSSSAVPHLESVVDTSGD